MFKLVSNIATVSSVALSPTAEEGVLPNSIDASTYGNIDEVGTEHLSLDFAVDFDKS